MKQFLWVCLLGLAASWDTWAQSPQFSQFYSNPLFQNPALAGDAGTHRFIANYRNQWAGVGIPFQTAAFSYDTYAEDAQVGLGLQLLHDRRGATLNSNQIAGQVSRSFYLDDKQNLRLTPGLQAAWVSDRFNTNDLLFVAQYLGTTDPLSQMGITQNKVVFSSGVRFDYDPQDNDEPFYWAGVSWHNMRIRNNDWLRDRFGLQLGAQFPMKFALFGHGYGHDLDRESAISVGMQLRKQGVNQQLDFGTNFIFSPLLVGIWYRGLVIGDKRRDAIIPTLGWARDNVLFQVSYDVPVSSLGADTGSFELSMWYGLDSLFKFAGKNSRERRSTRCLKY